MIGAAAPQLTPALALAAYQAAMTNATKPPNVTFEYTQTRSGPKRVITEVHRVYRNAAGDERNETLSVNGSTVAPPISVVYHKRAWPYDIDKFTAAQSEYDFTLTGTSTVSGKPAYAFVAKAKAPGAFAIEALYLAVDTGLPLRERFTANAPACAGKGSIDFGAFAAYWLPATISVSCMPPDSPGAASQLQTATYRETIRFSNYSFPARMPPEIFGR